MNNRFSYVVIIILVIIIFFQRSCSDKSICSKPLIEIVHDTIWKKTHDTITKEIKSVSVKYIHIPGLQYTPGTTIDTCIIRFNNLLKEHSKQTVYLDTLKLDSIGTITVVDTIWKNKLKKRIYIKNYKIPFITNTITKLSEPTRQLYIGGNLFGDKQQLQLVSPGILYKTKQDHIYQANIGINFNGVITYGLGAYWKIKLK